MLPETLFRKIRRIEIATRRTVDSALAGSYRSVFKGQGIEYEEPRLYQAGDDVRAIDWNLSSRTGTLHVKKFVEERELTVTLLVDVSASTRFGSGDKSKGEVAAEIAALLAFSAIRNNDRVGAALFTGEVEKYIPPRRGLKHALRVIREVLAFEPKREDTSLAAALEFIVRVLKKRSVLFVLSDFSSPDYERALGLARRRHDVVAITINDRGERDVPAVGWLRLRDAESIHPAVFPALLPWARQQQRDRMDRLARRRDEQLARSGVDRVTIWADQPYEKPLLEFFRMRLRRLRA